MKQEYSLRLYDAELVRFSLFENGLSGLQAEILHVDEAKKHLFPLDLVLDGNGVIAWLQTRVIPKNRAFVDEILKTLGLSRNDVKGIVDVCKGLSLNDSYWVVPASFSGKFADYNLYENKFSEILSLVAYTGVPGGAEIFSTSPELTTQGALPKAWRSMEDGIYLYKGGTSGFSNTGNEPYCEYYACQLAKAMGLNAVQYDLENWKGILASKCKLFTDIHTAYVPIGRIVRSRNLPDYLDFYKQLGKTDYEQVKSMLVFDAVVYNEDRHFGNFGILRENHSGKILGMAPIFDNGNSLFPFAGSDDLQHLSAYASTRSTAYGIGFDAVFREVVGPVQREQLRKLIGFRFQRHPRMNWPESRLRETERVINDRVLQLLCVARDSR